MSPRQASVARPDPVLEFMQRMWAVDHELQRVSKRMEAAVGLTGPQRFALVAIGRQPGVAAGVLASHLHLHPGTLTGIIARLAAAGLIERTWDADDGRRMRLRLTAAGRAITRRRRGTVEAAVRSAMAASSRVEQAAARDVLTRLADALRVVTGAVRKPSRMRSSHASRIRSAATIPRARRQRRKP
jgi:DNA-binding MarR family transcriptional regulator